LKYIRAVFDGVWKVYFICLACDWFKMLVPPGVNQSEQTCGFRSQSDFPVLHTSYRLQYFSRNSDWLIGVSGRVVIG